jgi:hypothetical protein
LSVFDQQRLFERDRLDSLRGLACVLLVAYHVTVDAMVFAQSKNELISMFNSMISPIRMPLFSFLSGLIYAYRPVEPGKFLSFQVKKVNRLMVPFLFMTLIIISLKSVATSVTNPVSISNAPYYLLYGYSHLWFLQAIFIIFVILSAIDSTFTKNRGLNYIALFIAGSIAYFTSIGKWQIFSIGGAIELLPFFSVGALFNAYSTKWSRYYSPALIATLALILLGSSVAFFHGIKTSQIEALSPFRFIMGISGVSLLFLLFPNNKVLKNIGVYSFSIFLFHSIFTAISFRILPGELHYLSLAGFTIALFGPIFVEIILMKRLPFLRMAIGKQ